MASSTSIMYAIGTRSNLRMLTDAPWFQTCRARTAWHHGPLPCQTSSTTFPTPSMSATKGTHLLEGGVLVAQSAHVRCLRQSTMHAAPRKDRFAVVPGLPHPAVHADMPSYQAINNQWLPEAICLRAAALLPTVSMLLMLPQTHLE